MAFTREVITLQIGNYTNYVGTHWWNIQESGFCYDPNADVPSPICHDVLFREGFNQQRQVTYTPRLILVDHKHVLKHLPQDGGLYSDHSSFAAAECEVQVTEEDTLWEPERLEVMRSETVEKTEFQRDLDANETAEIGEKNYDFRNNVSTWTDFMSTRYHPRSFNLLRSVDGGPTTNQQFDCYSSGTQLWSEEHFEDDFDNRVRQYMEECNNCQGFQLLFDATDGFAGLSVKCLEFLNDDYGKSSMVVPIFSPNRAKQNETLDEAMADSIRVLNTALTYGNLIEHSSLILPLSVMERNWRKMEQPRTFPHFDYDAQNLYETSSILATYLDTITLRYRLKDCTHLAGFCGDLSAYGRKLVGAGLTMPFRMDSRSDLIDCLDRFEGPMFTQLSPNTNCGTDRVVQTVSIRGIPEQRVKSTMSPKVIERQRKMAAYQCKSVSETMQLYFQCSYYASMAHVSSTETGMTTKKPFPLERFDNRLNATGFFDEYSTGADQIEQIQSIPVMATAQCSSDLAETLNSLHREAKRIKIARIPRFKESGLESEDLVDALENLLQFKDNYDETYEL